MNICGPNFFNFQVSNDYYSKSSIDAVPEEIITDAVSLSRIYNKHIGKNCCGILDTYVGHNYLKNCYIFIKALKVRVKYGNIFDDLTNYTVYDEEEEVQVPDNEMELDSELVRCESRTEMEIIKPQFGSNVSLKYDCEREGHNDTPECINKCLTCCLMNDIDQEWIDWKPVDLYTGSMKGLIDKIEQETSL